MFKKIYGGDSETCEGLPISLQFYSEDDDCCEIIEVDEYTACKSFLQWCGERDRDYLHVVYVHNLAFDLTEFFYGVHAQLDGIGGSFDFQVGKWHVYGSSGKPTFCRISDNKRRIILVDSFLWFQTSLDKAAKIVCPGLPKLKRPRNLGTVVYGIKDDDFVEYAMRDAEVAYFLGRSIEKIHQEFSIQQSVSLADMSAKIFKHHFLDYTIPQPNDDIIWAALHSYHGGKNNVLSNAYPRWHVDVNAFDISSAYPYAMSLLPSFKNARAYRRITFKNNRKPKCVPEFGVYCISGSSADCEWPVIFDHSFNPIRGKFSRIWVHGCEVNEALRAGEIKLTKIRGYMYDCEKDNGNPALKRYVDDFYQRKQKEKDPVLKYMYKLILNSLYGKFIQTRKSKREDITDIETMQTGVGEATELLAGSMFHSFIASTITAHTRAYMHRIEHEYKAIHTATDGIFSKCKRIKRIDGYPKSGLGSLEIEYRGDLCLLRNKCYILYSGQGKTKSQYFRGKRIAKYAKHGFQGTVYDLERLIAHNKRKYTVNKPNRLKQSLQRGLQVNKFEKRDMVLRVPPIRA